MILLNKIIIVILKFIPFIALKNKFDVREKFRIS